MVYMIHYLSLQLRGPVQESSPPDDGNGQPPVPYEKPKVTVLIPVCFHLLCVWFMLYATHEEFYIL